MVTDIVEQLRAKADSKRNRVGDLWGDHICRLAADEIERLREALREIVDHCMNDGLPNEMVAMRVIERVDETARAALEDRTDG